MEAEEQPGRFSVDSRWDCALGLIAGMPVCIGLLVAGVCAQRHGAVAGIPPLGRLLLGLLPLHVGLVGTAMLVVLLRHKHTPWPQLLFLDARAGGGWRPAARAAARCLVWVYPASLALVLAATACLHLLGTKPTGQPVLEMLLAERNPVWLLVTGCAILAVVPVLEELLFRLFLHDALCLIDVRAAAPLTAFTFALIHGVPEQIPALFLLALVLQDLRTRTGSLWAGIGLHAGFNGCSLLLLLVARLAGVTTG
jgi:membrane protease YdiL (CAAX protease family)